MKRSARDFRSKSEQVGIGEILSPEVWYRSPLWGQDHLVGEEREWFDDQIAWCGRGLGDARDWVSEELGGLWISQRTSSKCPYCKNRQKEWNERG